MGTLICTGKPKRATACVVRTNVGCRVVQLPEMTVEASDGSEEEGVFERTQLPTEQELLEGIQVRYQAS